MKQTLLNILLLKTSNINTACRPKIVWLSERRGIICRIVHLQTRKNPEQLQTVRIELSINSNTEGPKYILMLKFLEASEMCHIIQTLNSDYLLTNKMWLKSDLNNSQITWFRLKNYRKVGIELSINGNTKSPQI